MAHPPDELTIPLLIQQHGELRQLADGCEEFVTRLEDGEPVAAELAARLAGLRRAFADHSHREEVVLRALIVAELGDARVVDQLVDAHVDDHHSLQATLEEQEGSAVRHVIARLRRHLDDEEHYLLARRVYELMR